MQLGIIGLGRMGGNIARRLMLNGHTTVVFDRNTDFVSALQKDGATGVADLKALVDGLSKPRAVWVMLPSGAPTEDTIETLSQLLDADDIIIDGVTPSIKTTSVAPSRCRKKAFVMSMSAPRVGCGGWNAATA